MKWAFLRWHRCRDVVERVDIHRLDSGRQYLARGIESVELDGDGSERKGRLDAALTRSIRATELGGTDGVTCWSTSKEQNDGPVFFA
jgi:hypothetical protein